MLLALRRKSKAKWRLPYQGSAPEIRANPAPNARPDTKTAALHPATTWKTIKREPIPRQNANAQVNGTLSQPVRGRQLRGVLPLPGPQVRGLRLRLLRLCPQASHLRVPLGRQLPQLSIRRTQPCSAIGHTRRIAHNRHYITVGHP